MKMSVVTTNDGRTHGQATHKLTALSAGTQSVEEMDDLNFDGAQAMNDDRILTVAVNDYLAAGGENLGKVSARPDIEKTETDILLLNKRRRPLVGLIAVQLYRAAR